MGDLRIVVAGHVDHGKSTIIGRLLYDTGSLPRQMADKFDETGRAHHAAAFAFVTDQLSDEQEGSFTLDAAPAHFRTAQRDYTLIDTPGHREFLKNMITGATRADAAILVVDAAEGPLPQTYLHAYLISMLGIRQVIVTINKMDLVSYDQHRFRYLSRHLSGHLGKVGALPVAVIPISAQQGEHLVRPSVKMSWNTSPTLMETMEELIVPKQDGPQPLRFLVQCSLPAKGRQAILGRVTSGCLKQGQTIIFGPDGHETSVISVLLGQQETDAATAGQSVGLLLEDPAPVARGQIGFDAGHAPLITDRLPARVFWMHPRPLAVNDRFAVFCGTQTRPGHIEGITRAIDPVSLAARATRAAHLRDGEVAEVIIRTDSPVCIDSFDVAPELGRFAILRDGRMAGGGVVTR